MTRLGTVQVDHRDAVERLRAEPGAWLPVGEYRSQGSADAAVKAIRTGQWPHNRPSPYTAGEFEADTELSEFGVRVLARYLGTAEQQAADAFNAAHPIGTPVVAYPGCRPEDDPNDERLVTRTRSRAQVLGGHTAVVWVDGHGACIALTHVDPFRATDTSPEANAARYVPQNSRPLCRDFQPKPEPAEFWCATCGWNEPMHDDEDRRTAIAEALKCLPTTPTPTAEETP
ncbi:hypothetical protein [Streptomyces sp. NPDC056817]|uniref:hypothetical protein n=1 Tax=Streptomyces sp. NPDC056817 TaxID=3345950 RepID=UPI00367D8405